MHVVDIKSTQNLDENLFSKNSEPTEAIDNLIGEAASNEKQKATHLATSNGTENTKTNGVSTEMTKNMTIFTEKVRL